MTQDIREGVITRRCKCEVAIESNNIIYCPLHSAAPKLLEAAKNFQQAWRKNLCLAPAEGYLLDAIDEAEGREL